MEIKIAFLICYLAYGTGLALAILSRDLEAEQSMNPVGYIILVMTWPFWKGVIDGQAINVRRELLRWTSRKE